MIRAFRELIERQIAKARAEGKLKNLDGEGQPLPRRDPSQTTAEAVGMRMMAEASALPQEFEIKQKLEAARAEFRNATTQKDRKEKLADIAKLELDYNLAVEARKKFLG